MNQDVSRLDSRSAYSQSERLIQIGSYLQEVRESQDLSLEQVATKTMISARHLRAIEAGNLGTLPEAIYVKGFIKRYAELLGLDGDEISDAFPLYSTETNLKPTWQDSDVAQLRQAHLYFAYVALITVAVIGLGAVLVRLDNGDRPGQVNADTSDAELTQDNSEAIAPSPSNTDPGAESAEVGNGSNEDQNQPNLSTILNSSEDGTPQPLELDPALADKPVRVALQFKERSWLRVTVDGQLDFEGVLAEGTQRIWAADDNVTVRVGNAGGVLAAFNGSDAEIMGDPGSVQERRFSADTAVDSVN